MTLLERSTWLTRKQVENYISTGVYYDKENGSLPDKEDEQKFQRIERLETNEDDFYKNIYEARESINFPAGTPEKIKVKVNIHARYLHSKGLNKSDFGRMIDKYYGEINPRYKSEREVIDSAVNIRDQCDIRHHSSLYRYAIFLYEEGYNKEDLDRHVQERIQSMNEMNEREIPADKMKEEYKEYKNNKMKEEFTKEQFDSIFSDIKDTTPRDNKHTYEQLKEANLRLQHDIDAKHNKPVSSDLFSKLFTATLVIIVCILMLMWYPL